MVKDRIRSHDENRLHRALVEENRRERLEKSQHQQGHKLVSDHHCKVEADLFPLQKILAQCRHHSLCSKVDLPINHANTLHKLFIKASKELLPDNFVFQFDADLANVLNLHYTPISGMIAFVKHLSHFQPLTVDDKVILLKNNTRCLQPLLVYLFQSIFNVPILVIHPGQDHINNALASSYTLLTNSIARDSKLMLLCLSTLLFCPSLLTVSSSNGIGYMTDSSRQLIRYAYDEYGQILWQYLMRQSKQDELHAMKSYTKLISVFLRLQQLISEIYDRVSCLVQTDRLHQVVQSLLYLV